MKKQDILQILENHLAELSDTVEQKSGEMKTSLNTKIAEVEQFLMHLNAVKERLESQLHTSRNWLAEMDTSTDFNTELTSMVADDADISLLKNELAERVNQHLNQLKADTVAIEQSLSDHLLETQQQLSGKASAWYNFKQQFNARFGDKIAWAKVKLAEQLEFCADKLKA